MDAYYSLGAGIAAFALFVQLTMLGLQSAAYRRHGHKSFLILCIASVLGLIYACLMGIPYIVPLDASILVSVTAIGALVGAMSALLAVLGTALLFKSYRNLAEVAARSSSDGA